MTLLAVPNFSEGRDTHTIRALGERLQAPDGVRVIDIHSDPDHHRSVFTLAGPPGRLGDALLGGAAVALERIDLRTPRGAHPHVGALDVAPVVYASLVERGAACAEALVVGARLAEELELPVLLYGELAGGRTRAQLRRGGPQELARRLREGELVPEFGPARAHPSAGAVLVCARAPLVAFNVTLAPPADLNTARRIASELREGGRAGLSGLRAIGVELVRRGGIAQVSMNVEDPLALPLVEVVRAVRARAPIQAAELVGLAPRAALEGLRDEVAIESFDPDRQLIENALGL